MGLRVFELAKELKMPSKELLQKLNDSGIKAKNIFAGLSNEQVAQYKNELITPSAKSQETVHHEEISEKKSPRRIISSKKNTEGTKVRRPIKGKTQPAVPDLLPDEQKATEETTVIETQKPSELKEEDVAIVIKDKNTDETEAKKAPESREEVIVAQPETPEIHTPKTPEIQTTETSEIQTKEVMQDNKAPHPEKAKEPLLMEKAKEERKKTKPSSNRARIIINGNETEDAILPAKLNSKILSPETSKKITGKNVKTFKKNSEEKKGKSIWVKPSSQKHKRQRGAKSSQQEVSKHTFKPRKKSIRIGEVITVGELASEIGIKVSEIIKKLMALDIMATITQPIEGETAALVATEFGIEVEVSSSSIEDALEQTEDVEEDLLIRSPIITIMGHVDHGKTSLLDKIRTTNVTKGEAGGITQHIGAYSVNSSVGKMTFLDTPGHEAFTSMRARGANVTDIVILVVAADDGPKPQTIEAIHHAKAADVPIIVAINKCDKENADPSRTAQMLIQHGLVSEEFGGDTIMVQVSAKSGLGIDKLLEMIALQAEVLELKENPNKPATGVVIESKLDKGRGNVATILIQSGTLKKGDHFVVGTVFGRVRAMQNERGKELESAGPSTPVEIIGISGLPNSGDKFRVGSDEKQVRQIATVRNNKEKEAAQVVKQKTNLESLFNELEQGEKKTLNLIIKTDVVGSLEAISDSLSKLGNEEVQIKIIHGAVGAITQSDVVLAGASDAVIMGFNVRPEAQAKAIAQSEGVDIRLYTVIYDAIDDVKKALEGMLEPIVREVILGKVEVKQVFIIPKIGMIAGCHVSEGKVTRDSLIRVLRDHIVIFEGKLSSLRRFKDDVKEVQEGFECGIGIESYKDLKEGDVLETYFKKEEAAKLE